MKRPTFSLIYRADRVLVVRHQSQAVAASHMHHVVQVRFLLSILMKERIGDAFFQFASHLKVCCRIVLEPCFWISGPYGTA